jgi:tetratricopeptide (TPR) repeat protein
VGVHRPAPLAALVIVLAAVVPVAALPESPPAAPTRSWSRVAAESWRDRAEAQLARGETAAALTSYTRALRADPTFGPAYLGLAAIRLAQGDLQQAEWLLTRATTLDDVRAEALSRRAGLFLATGRAEAALLDLRLAAEVEPTIERLRALGDAYVARRAWVAALAVWRRLRASSMESADPRRHQADEMIAALTVLAAESDAVQHDTGERNWIRRALSRQATK